MRVTDIKYLDWDSWFEMWSINKDNTLETMISNMVSDLKNGYDYFGNSIQSQIKEIESYRKDIYSTYELFKTMNTDEVDRWCFYDMKKHGVI